MTTASTGPLTGLKIIEMAGMGPTPFCAMLLADMGADIITVAAPAGRTNVMPLSHTKDPMWRGRMRLEIDLKEAGAAEQILLLFERADVVLEGFRPGVMERLGLGPEVALQRNASLVYGRVTGWGQDGPLAMAAGHDPNYLSITGALHSIGYPDRPPVPPLNLVGDYGGGALYLAMGVLAALLRVRAGEPGQVVDAAMVDGVTSMMTPIYSLHQAGIWGDTRGENLMDGGSPFGCAYETADGRFVMVAAVEKEFYACLLEGLGLSTTDMPAREDKRNWPELRRILAEKFRSQRQDQWVQVFQDRDACVTPILDLREAPRHPHNLARRAFISVNGSPTPAPAPRFSRTPSSLAQERTDSLEDALKTWGLSSAAATALGALASPIVEPTGAPP